MESLTSAVHSKDDRFRFVLENLGDLVWSVDMDLHFIYVSPSVEDILGYSIEEISKKSLADILTSQSFKQFKENILWEKPLNQDGWHVMEMELKRKDNRVFKADVKLSLIENNENGLLEILGACRKKSDENIKIKALEKALNEWEKTFDAVTDIVAVISPEFEILRLNKKGFETTGLKPNEVIGKKCYEIMHNTDSPIPECPCSKTLETKKAPEGEFSQFGHHYITTAAPIFNENNKLIAFAHTIKDITDHKNVEEAVKESEERYRQLFEKMLDGFAFHKIVVDDNGKPIDYIFLEVNSEFEYLTGLKRGNIIGRKVTEVIPGIEDDPAHWIEIYGAVALEGKEFNFEQYTEALGKWFSVSTYSPKKGYFAAVFEDITQRKLSEEAFQTIVESTMGTIGQEYFDKILDTLCKWLKADCAAIGEIVNGDEVRTLSVIVDGKQVENYQYKLKGTPCENAADKGYCFHPKNVLSQFPQMKKLQELKAQSYVGVSLRNISGNPIGILCVISRKKMKIPFHTKEVMGIIAAKASAELERIQAESALKESEEQFRTLFEHAGEALFLIDPEKGRFIDVNEHACEALGYSKDELLNLTISDIDPAFSKEQFKGFIRSMRKDKPVTVDAKYKRKDQSDFPVEIRTGFIDINGKTHLLSLVRDITLRKQAEEELQWELDVNKALAELSNALISPTTHLNELVQIVLVYSQALTNSEHGYVSTIDPENGDNVCHTLTKMMDSCLIEGEDKRTVFPKGPDGRYQGLWGFALNTKRPFYTNSPQEHEALKGTSEGHIPLKNFLTVPAVIGGILVGQIALANAIDGYTDRKLEAIRQIAHLYALAIYRMRAEGQLRESEEKFRELAELLPETIFLANEEGMLTFVNPAGIQAFGYTQSDIENGFNLLDAFSPEERQRVLENIALLFTDGKDPGTEYLAQRKDGSTFPVVIYANPVIRGGKPAGLRGIVVDITQRKQAEEQIERALSEKKLLLSELKHRVNNNLQLLMSMVNMWIMEAQSEEAKDALHEVEGLISAMALVHSEAQIDGKVKRIQLKKFLKELANGVIKIRSHRDLEVTHSVDGDEVWLELDQANPVSLIANELLLNALKHAFIGRDSGHITVSLKDKDDAVSLSIKDNGVGISKEVDLKKPDSLGLDLIKNMVEQLNGKMDIIVKDGTLIEIEFPKGVEQNGR